MVAAGLSAWLADGAEFKVVTYVDRVEAVGQALRSHGADILMVDLHLQDQLTLPAFSQWLSEWPSLLILMHSMSDEQVFASRCIAAGARGYLMKSCDRDACLRALRELRDHQYTLSAELQHKVVDHLLTRGRRGSTLGELTQRQHAILGLIAEGRSRSEMAAQLGVSVKTIDAHKTNIRERLGLKNSQALLQFALRLRA